MNTVVLFVLLLIGPAPNYIIIDSTVFKNNDETMEQCQEVRLKAVEFMKDGMKQILEGMGVTRDEMKHYRVEATQCVEIVMADEFL